MSIEWKEPPAAKNLKWSPIIAEIKSEPGRWAFVGNMALTSGYRQANIHSLEIRTSNRSGHKADIYLRQPEEN